jgi:hypothetical protein
VTPSQRKRLRLAGGDHLFMAEAISAYWGRRFDLSDWDAPRPTDKCPHCRGTGLVHPQDPHNECGFCVS